jgi:hypothetical protein
MTERYIAQYMEDNHINDKMTFGDLMNEMGCVFIIDGGNNLISYDYHYNPDEDVMKERIDYITNIRTTNPVVKKITAEKAKAIRQKNGVWDI